MKANLFSLHKLSHIKLLYAFALSFIAFTLLTSSVIMRYAINKNASDARVINLSGRQRMLSQRLTKCCLAMALQNTANREDNDARVQEFNQALTDWMRAHKGLQFGDKGLALPARSQSAEIKRLFAGATPYHEAMVKALQQLQTLTQQGKLTTELASGVADTLLNNEQHFLKLMDQITFQFDLEARERVATLKRIETVLLAVGMMILLFEFLFVFRPSIHQLGVTIHELERSRLDLEHANNSLKISLDESKRLADMAQAANRAKSEFLANMSHEIRTPMNAIIGFSEILVKLLAESRQKEYALAIRNAGQALLRLINDILDLSKVEAGKLQVVLTAFNIESVMSEIQNIFAQKIQEKGLELVISADPKLPKAAILDEIRLRQILLNLVGNAIKFTDTGKITIRSIVDFTEDDPGRFKLTVEVADTGIGIPVEAKERIFAAFEQRPNQDHAKYGGTGLGLTISRRLAELMGGTLHVADNPEGKGSQFTLVLENIPVAVGIKELNSAKTAEDETSIMFQKAVILLADDVEVNRHLLKAYLDKYPFEYLEAADGKMALQLIREKHPDLVLTDFKMPIMSGLDVLQATKADPQLKHIPVVAVTASLIGTKIDEIKSSFDGFLHKPLFRADLIREIARHLPHEIREVPVTISVSNNGEFLASDLTSIRDLPSLVKVLRSLLENDFPILRKTLRNSKVKSFGEQLIHIGREHDAKSVEQAGIRMVASADSYNIASIKIVIEQIPVLVAQLEEALVNQ